MADSRQALIRLLQLAYSGELAAATAYRGHAAAVRDLEERRRIRVIEEDEWRHRRRVGEMLAELGAQPSRLRELRMKVTGWLIALLCHVGGWFIPMYGAGKIERRNIVEYENAARLAVLCGRSEPFVEDLVHMAEVEWDHEQFFRGKAAAHVLSRLFRLWPPPGPRSRIRDSFSQFTERARAAG